MLALFFVSGVAGLVYEVGWSRMIGLRLGHTEQAAAVTLAAYFLGMALGYGLASRWARRGARPLRVYALAELAAAAWALAAPRLAGLLDAVDGAGLLQGPGAAGLLARTAAATLLLLPATVALGATLPSIAEHLAGERVGGAAAAVAYGVNTLGAVTGALLATHVLILALGVQGSTALAAGLSAASGLVAWALDRRAGAPPRAAADPAPPIVPLWYAAAAVSGFVTLGLEVLYARLYGLVFHNSTYTFGAVLVVFLLALAAGSLLAACAAGRAAGALGWTAAAGAAAIPASLLAFAAATRFEYYRTAGHFAEYLVGSLGLVALGAGPVALCLGAVLPLTWSAAGRAGGASVVGRLAAAGTLAGAAGALVSGFVLLPRLDLWLSFAALAALDLLLAAAVFRRRWTRARALGLAVVAAGLAAFALTFARRVHGPSRPGETVLERTVSAHGWTDVVHAPERGGLLLRQNLHHELGGSGYAWYLEREGHVGLLLHPRPRRVLFLGLGTGITAAAALRHPEVEAVEVVELAEPVVRGARRFAEHNQGIVDHPRARVVADDARHFLRRRAGLYDVIVSDLFVPWHSRTGYLYTVEHYRAARSRLAPGGLFCQWLLTSELGARELDLVADSFASVFPYTTVWRADAQPRLPLLALVGSEEPLRVDAGELGRRLAAAAVPAEPGAPAFTSPPQLLELYLGRWRVRRPGWLNTDDRPRVEFLAPIADADFTILIGRRRVDYEAQVLSRLPREGLTVTGPATSTPPAPSRR